MQFIVVCHKICIKRYFSSFFYFNACSFYLYFNFQHVHSSQSNIKWMMVLEHKPKTTVIKGIECVESTLEKENYKATRMYFHLSYSLFASFRWEINNNLYRLPHTHSCLLSTSFFKHVWKIECVFLYLNAHAPSIIQLLLTIPFFAIFVLSFFFIFTFLCALKWFY